MTAPQRLLPNATPDARGQFVTGLFDRAAPHYDRINGWMSLGSGRWYRRWALERAGLGTRMRVLDVATGTGLVARAALDLVEPDGRVVGVDPSPGMLRQVPRGPRLTLAQARAEGLPFRAATFDMVTMGYALRHVADLETTFAEYFRVLRPGGRVLVLEISRPRGALAARVLRSYLVHVVGRLTRVGTGSADAEQLMRYYWETIAAAAEPETVLSALGSSGFRSVARRVFGGVLSEYGGVRPDARSAGEPLSS